MRLMGRTDEHDLSCRLPEGSRVGLWCTERSRLSGRRMKPLATHGRTIHSGQTEKNSLRANVFRVTPESGHFSMQSACLKGATSRHARLELRPRRIGSSGSNASRPVEAPLQKS